MINQEKETGLYTPEEADERIVSKNLEKMNSEMMPLVMNESIAGNAGIMATNSNEYSCAGANGWADKNSGEIFIFGNIQNIPQEIMDRAEEFTFRVGMFTKNNSSKNTPKIIEFLEKEKFSVQARLSIEESIRQFNENISLKES